MNEGAEQRLPLVAEMSGTIDGSPVDDRDADDRDGGNPAARLRLAGEPGVWLVVSGEMTMFAILFLVFSYYRAHDLALFRESGQVLDARFGLLNTLLLLFSSWFVVTGIGSAKAGRARLTLAMLAGAITCGVGFVLSKSVEWTHAIGLGHTMMSNDFFMFYYVLTGLHLAHVLIGLAILGYMTSVAARKRLNAGDIHILESGATFWHMVDLLWIILFPLLYIIR